MPPNCNALLRIDRKKDFTKENCQWGIAFPGKKKKHKQYDMFEGVK